MYESLITDYAKEEGVNEHLKAVDQMKWVQMTKNIEHRAKEIIETEILYR